MIICLLILLLLASLQILRCRRALKRSVADQATIMDDYQDLGREFSDETDRLEAALVRILESPDITHSVAYEARVALAQTGSMRLMPIYAPERYARHSRAADAADREFEAALVELNRHRAANPLGYWFGQRWFRLIDRVQGWWDNPS